MLKIAIECSYNNNFKSKDAHGARYIMQEMFKKNNIELVRVSVNKYNNNKKQFTEYNTYTPNGNVIITKQAYKPDIIRNRKATATTYRYDLLKEFAIIPSQHISIISNDKYETYMFLKEYQPKTFLLSGVFKNKQTQEENIGTMVLKPIRANGGRGIILTTITELIKDKEKYKGLEDLFIVQEFKDFSKGYPGIVDGNHDIRFMFAGKSIIETTLRIPKAGGFKSNIGSGGTQITMSIKNIPTELIQLAKKIYKEISKEQLEIISIDFAYCKTEKKRYMLEINGSPGTWYYQTDRKIVKEICKGLIKFFKNLSI